MSLVKTLAKAAVGIAIAKGVGGMMSQSGSASAGRASGRSTPYGGSVPQTSASQGGSLGGMLGKMLGGNGPRGSGSLGGALEELSQISTESFSDSGAAARPFDPPKQGSLGDMLNQSLEGFGREQATPSPEQEAMAGVLLRALIQAAKADGRIDAGEKEQLTQQLGDLDHEELDFVKAELAKPVDVPALVRDVPAGAGGQVYMMSVMGIDLDTNKEARYLHELSQALGLEPGMVNSIHDRMGEPRLFR